MTATIVLLNGVGSAGKSSIARALQRIASRPFLHVAMDTFLDMLPPPLLDHPDGLQLTPTANGVAIHAGPVVQRLLDGMRRAITSMAEAGNDIIVDDVLLGQEMEQYARLLAGHRLIRVGVHCPLDVLEARERARTDRVIGLARWQFPRVHADRSYDLEVDTSTGSAEACATRIRDGFDL